MARRAIRTERLIAVLGGAVLLLGVVLFFVFVRNGSILETSSASDRALRQLRDHLGPNTEIHYLEVGKGRAVCGYAGTRGGSGGPAFISRPNRILLETDPLKAEFKEMLSDVCPGFMTPPPGVY
ncbi:hypothetical protein [Brevundimonas sp.]|uniref:hypothetical protein n=1 Tax=Brevundimonas sp. TaxID=1871086 RepID=UPI003562616F